MSEKTFDKKKWVIGILVISLLLAGGIFIWFLNSTNEIQFDTDTVEVSLNDVPEKIRKEIEENLENPGAYYYKTDDSDDVYALLTTGTVLGMDMDVVPVIEDGGVTYFSINLYDTNKPDEVLLYKIFKTRAKYVAADELLLKNPYSEPNAEGMNVGALQKNSQDDGYYIVPIMTTQEVNRVYIPANDQVKNLTDGIYMFNYKLDNQGPQITAATKLDDYEINFNMTELLLEPHPTATFTISDGIKFDAYIAEDSLATLKEVDFNKYTINGRAHLSFDGEYKISQVEILNYEAKSEN